MNYLYKKPDGTPDVSRFELDLDLFPGYQLISTSESEIDAFDKVFVGNNLVPRTKGYEEMRKASYPTIGDQLDSLWHAMDQNVLPRIEPFYTDIKTVKQQYPKP